MQKKKYFFMKMIQEGNPLKKWQPPVPKKATCGNCGCIMEYDQWDIKNSFFWPYKPFIRHLVCPNCKEAIELDINGNQRAHITQS